MDTTAEALQLLELISTGRLTEAIARLEAAGEQLADVSLVEALLELAAHPKADASRPIRFLLQKAAAHLGERAPAARLLGRAAEIAYRSEDPQMGFELATAALRLDPELGAAQDVVRAALEAGDIVVATTLDSLDKESARRPLSAEAAAVIRSQLT